MDVDLTAIFAGVRAGVPVLFAVFALQFALALVADDPSDAWAVPILGLLLWAFARAGAAAARRHRARPLTSAAGAGSAVFAVWIPLRVTIAIAGDSDNPFAGLGAGLALALLVSLAAGLLATRRHGTEERDRG